MYILMEACKTPAVLRTIYFGYLFWELLSVLIPIVLIVLLMVDFSKAVVSSNEDGQSKSISAVSKRIIAAFIIFFIPYIVDVVMIALSSAGVDIGTDYNECLNTVKAIDDGTDSFDVYDKAYEAENEIIRNTHIVDNDNGNNSKASSTAEKLISLIRKEIGTTDGTKYGSGGAAWCGYFTTWALKNTTMDDGTTVYNYLSKNGSISDGNASGTWPAFRGNNNSSISFNRSKAYGGNYTPKAGDVIYFHWDNGYCRTTYGRWDGRNQCSDHVGIVEKVVGTTVYTIEGNSGGKVSNKNYSIDSNNIIAYGSWYK